MNLHWIKCSKFTKNKNSKIKWKTYSIAYSMDLHTVPVDHLLKTRKEYKNSNKQKIHKVLIKAN